MKTLRQCPVELPDDEECDATDDHSSNAAGQKIKPLFSITGNNV
ncbi:MAG: hypothetical protein WDN26_17860 [Chitinophagaceae bacterium]